MYCILAKYIFAYLYNSLPVSDTVAELTTVSLDLLTDRTLSLREDADVFGVLYKSECEDVIYNKYNVTRKEYFCVCYSYCPWRSLIEDEAVLYQVYIDNMNREIQIRQTILGTAYSIIFILGVTGTTYRNVPYQLQIIVFGVSFKAIFQRFWS